MRKIYILSALLLVSIAGNIWQFSKNQKLINASVSEEKQLSDIVVEVGHLQTQLQAVANQSKAEAILVQKTKENEARMAEDSNDVISRLKSENDDLRSKLEKANTRSETLSEQPSQSPAVYPITPKTERWVSLAHFNGAGTQRSPSFQVTSDSWRIHWQMHPRDAAVFSFLNVMSEGASDDLLVNTGQAGDEISYGHGAGTFDLKINALNCDWEIEVEQTAN